MKTFVTWIILFSVFFVFIGYIFGIENMTFMSMISWLSNVCEKIAAPFRTLIDVFTDSGSSENPTWWESFGDWLQDIFDWSSGGEGYRDGR